MDICRIIANGLKTGIVLTAATTAVVMLASRKENGSVWAAVNSVAHIIDGDDVVQPAEFSPRESLLGVGINCAAMCAWGVLYEAGMEFSGAASGAATGMTGAAASFLIDYKLVPKRFTPGIEKRLSPRSVMAAYFAIAVTFAASGLWNRRKS